MKKKATFPPDERDDAPAAVGSAREAEEKEEETGYTETEREKKTEEEDEPSASGPKFCGAPRSLAPPDAPAGQGRSRSPSIDAPSKSPRPSSLQPVAPGSSRSRSVSPSPAPDLPGAISDPVAAEVQKKRARFAKAV